MNEWKGTWNEKKENKKKNMQTIKNNALFLTDTLPHVYTKNAHVLFYIMTAHFLISLASTREADDIEHDHISKYIWYLSYR